jgi:hypothetical protein
METTEIKRFCSRETFLQMKEHQKLYPSDQRTAKEEFKAKHSEVDKKLKEMLDKNGDNWVARYEINKHRPSEWHGNVAFDARSYNIVYGMIRGKSYKQIERKVKEGNEPYFPSVMAIIDEYKLDPNDFFNGKELK